MIVTLAIEFRNGTRLEEDEVTTDLMRYDALPARFLFPISCFFLWIFSGRCAGNPLVCEFGAGSMARFVAGP